MRVARKQLIVYGDAAVDVVLRAAAVPQPGGDARVESMQYLPGGSAANCAVAAACLGIETHLLAQVGEDDFGRRLGEDLQRANLHLEGLLSRSGVTGTMILVSTPDGERTFFSLRGVNELAYAGELDAELFKQSAFLHLTGYSFQDAGSRQTALDLMHLAKQAGVPISLDPSYYFMQQLDRDGTEMLRGLALFSPNLDEAALLTGRRDPESAARMLLALGIERVLLKLGAEGCLLADAGQLMRVPPFAVERVVDSTGAGDAFCAGYLAGQIWELSAFESAQVGNAAAAAVVSAQGGHSGALSGAELCARLSAAGLDDLAYRVQTAREAQERVQ
jgi:Sugar kinases, ribokinase family